VTTGVRRKALCIVAALLCGVLVTPFAAGTAGAQEDDGAVTCDTPGEQTVPPDADVQCDAARGWRRSAWIGASGDGIVLVEHATPGWTTLFFGPLCASGVAAATPEQLVQLGVPQDLADAWGFPPSACGDETGGEPPAEPGTDANQGGGLARTGSDPTALLWFGVALLGCGALVLAAQAVHDRPRA
jgi:hypothetical protein